MPVPNGIEFQARRLTNLEDALALPDLRVEDVHMLWQVAQRGFDECMVGHHPQIADEFTRLQVEYQHRFPEAFFIPEPRSV